MSISSNSISSEVGESKSGRLAVKELYAVLDRELAEAAKNKTFKREVPLDGKQAGIVNVSGKTEVMLASNNYLGLANHPRVVQAAQFGLDMYGFGMASVRFLCGTQKIHLELEEKIAAFLGMEAAILHSSCFAANEALFAALLSADFGYADYSDIIYSDQLNHASIIDGIRLARMVAKSTELKAYRHNDLAHLQQLLSEHLAENCRIKTIATDGVFSMEGEFAFLEDLVDIAAKNDALLIVDDSHATGVLGKRGRGTPEHCGVHGRVDVITGTLGKALGGAAGGFVAGKKPLIEYLRQKSRPYTFSNTLPPAIVCGTLEALDMIEKDNSLVEKLQFNTSYFRKEIKNLGFKILEGIHPIVPVMLGEAAVAMDMSDRLLKEGVYVRGLWYPVVPKGEARLRVQISADHELRDLDFALSCFAKVGKQLGVIGK
ncbi:MAG: glycine C-acetyltransferase [Candidatus Melainabacteria bacterium]|nr:MAG: glycine C-acetyltransferase [Candidatus Melainabacteria bacterium]